MNAPPALFTVNPREASSRLGPVWREAAECGPAAAGRGPEVGGGLQKIWRVHTYGLGGLQLLEIPQNSQRFVWKSLDKNSLDLEKLAEIRGRPPSFRRLCSPPRRGRYSIAAAFECTPSSRARAPSSGCESGAAGRSDSARFPRRAGSGRNRRPRPGVRRRLRRHLRPQEREKGS